MWYDKRVGILMGGICREREISFIAQHLVGEQVEVAFIALQGRRSGYSRMDLCLSEVGRSLSRR